MLAVLRQHAVAAPVLNGGTAQPDLLRRLGNCPKFLQQIQRFGGGGGQAQSLWGNHAISHAQLIATPELDGTSFMHKHAVAGGDPNDSPIGGAY